MSPPTPSLPRARRRRPVATAARDVEGELRCDGIGRQRQGANRCSRARTDPPMPVVGAPLASLPVCLPAYPRVEVTMPVCLYDEFQSDLVNKIFLLHGNRRATDIEWRGRLAVCHTIICISL